MQSKPSFGDILARGLSGMVTKSVGARESGFYSRWGWDWGSTWSGKSVTIDSALQNDTVWACVKLISEAVSTLPLNFYQRTDDGRKIATDHPLYEILHAQPNALMSAVNFWQAVSASLLLWGNAYTEVVRSADRSRVISLNFLLPDRMRVSWSDRGTIQYEYFDTPTSIGRRIAPRDLMHIRAFTLDGQVGLSAIQYGRNAIASTNAADEAAAVTFRDATRASGVFTMDAVLGPKQRDEIREHVRKVSKDGGVYVMEKGAGFHALRFSPHDAELLATRSFSVETICRWFRVPPVMIGHGDKQSSWPTSTEAQGMLFLRYVLRSCILGIEQEIRRSLLTPVERQQYFGEFSIEGLLRGDSAARTAFYTSALSNGWMTRNEVRRLENLPKVEGGDVLTVQSNMMPLDQLGTATVAGGASARNALLAWLDIQEKGATCTANQQPA